MPAHPAYLAFEALLAHADGRHESVGETILGHTMRTLGYRFTPQVLVTIGGQWWRMDFELDDHPVGVEFDGLAKYGGGLVNPTPDQLRRALAQEKWREDRLRETGREMVRFVWHEADNPRARPGTDRRGHSALPPTAIRLSRRMLARSRLAAQVRCPRHTQQPGFSAATSASRGCCRERGCCDTVRVVDPTSHASDAMRDWRA